MHFAVGLNTSAITGVPHAHTDHFRDRESDPKLGLNPRTRWNCSSDFGPHKNNLILYRQ